MTVTPSVRQWAMVGARARLQAINQERETILKAFPGLRREGAAGPSATPGLNPKRRFSAAARRRMSAGMRKFWARRKAATKAKATA